MADLGQFLFKKRPKTKLSKLVYSRIDFAGQIQVGSLSGKDLNTLYVSPRSDQESSIVDLVTKISSKSNNHII